MAQTVPFDALLGASKTGLAIGAAIYQLDGSTSYAAFSTTGWYEAPAGSGGWHHPGLSLPDAGGVVAVGIAVTEYLRIAVDAVLVTATPTNVSDAQTAITNAIAGLNNLSSAQAQSAAAAALAAYDPPTKAELDTAEAAIINAIPTTVEIDTELTAAHGAGSWVDAGGGGATAAQVWAYATRTLTALGSASGIVFTYTVIDSTTTDPIADVTVWFSTSNDFLNVVWYGSTNIFGVALDVNGNKPRLDAGTYYVLCRKAGYVFAIDTEVVS